MAVSGTVIGQLPQPRSDAGAVTIGRTAYVVGGYDGTTADPQVLSTTDGSSFRQVGSLPVPVRYPAVAARGRMIYAFGGQRIGGAAGAIDDIQRIDTTSGRIAVERHGGSAEQGLGQVADDRDPPGRRVDALDVVDRPGGTADALAAERVDHATQRRHRRVPHRHRQ